MLLNSTGNDEVPSHVRDIALKLHGLDPDGQRFRYGKAFAKGREAVISLAMGTRIYLTSVVAETDEGIDSLFGLTPRAPENSASG